MQWVAKAVQYYKDINPATLTGAIDVIVVERPTEDGDVELACSPFHVRFGKLSVLRPIDKKVRITVNDEKIPFYMKVGETGEAFFVFETDADVPEDLQTSPLTGPVSDDEIQPEVEGESAPGEPEFLDLGAPQTAEQDDGAGAAGDDGNPILSGDSSPTSSRYASMDQTRLNSPAHALRTLPPFTPYVLEKDKPTTSTDSGAEEDDAFAASPTRKSGTFVPAAALSLLEKTAGLGTAALASVSRLEDQNLTRLVRKKGRGEAEEGPDEEVEGKASQELGELEKGMREDLEGLTLDKGTKEQASNFVGDDVRIAAREKDADVRNLLVGPGGLGRARGADGELAGSISLAPSPTGVYKLAGLDYFASVGDEIGHAPEKSGDLMLDMSGYKIEADDAEDKLAGACQGELVPGTQTEINGPIDERAEAEMVAFTQGLLQSVDPKTLRGFFDPSDSEACSSRATSPLPTPTTEEKDDPKFPDQRPGALASSTRPLSLSSLQSLHAEAELDSSPQDGVYNASPNQFSLRVGSRIHVFELSLCGGDDFGHDRILDDQKFAEQQISFTQFMEQDDITSHSNLVVKYGDRYLTWDNASPVLASLAVYRKSLVDHPEHHRQGGQLDVYSKRASRGWGLWWGRKGATGSTVSLPPLETSPPTSPPISQPSSPRSLPLPTSPGLVSPLATPAAVEQPDNRHYAKTLRLTSDQLLGLKKGMNTISFSVRSSYSGYATCTSRIFLWESDFQVVISDIDGTITKSDALGHVFTMIGRDWTHLGVAKLYTDIARNGYKMMYLTSRAIGQADTTREYLKGIKQNGFRLPDGPVIMSPDRLMTSLHREVVLRKPEVFKMACLRDIKRLFGDVSPFYAGFGNRITDALSYRTVDIPSSRIFTIDTNGEVKMELLDLAGYKSSYIYMTDLVDQQFPPVNRKTVPAFTDFNFWRAPVAHFDLPDLSPPSPALSARSDSSRLGFPRLGSIASSLSRRSSRATLVDAPAGRGGRGATPSSPLLQATLVEEPYDVDEYDERSESESMPGSLPNDSDFERLRAAALRNVYRPSEAEAYKKAVRDGDEEGDEDDEEEEEEEGGEDYGRDDEFGEELDFSSVPYL